MYKKALFVVVAAAFGASVLVAPQPTLAHVAATPAPQTTLAAQIESLLEQIEWLQTLIQERAEAENKAKPRLNVVTDDDFEIIETVYFGTDFEAIYEVDDNLNLIRRDRQTGVRISDLRLWDLFIDTIGKRETKRYIDELRIFDKSTSHIGGFVELRRSSIAPDYWILGINEDDFDSRSEPSRRSYSALFIHEFAHLIIEDDEDMLSTFADLFWSQEDYQHAADAEELTGQALDDALEDYFANNEARFVSDYATYNPDEDFAETFTYFVINDRPRSSREAWSDKVDFMYRYERLKDVRYEIRNNLDL